MLFAKLCLKPSLCLALAVCAAAWAVSCRDAPPIRGHISIGTGSVSGFVRNGQTQELLPGVAVSIGGKSAVTSQAGVYEIRDLEPGQQTLSAVREGYHIFTDALTIAETAQIRNIELVPAAAPALPAASPSSGPPDGSGASAHFQGPLGIAVDAQDNVYVSDSESNRIRKITPQGEVTTVAGSDPTGFADGVGATALFHHPQGLTVDREGSIYVADKSNRRVRKISPGGVVSTIAGHGLTTLADGATLNLQMFYPEDVAIDVQGNLYAADSGHERIWKVGPGGVLTTLAGRGNPGFADGSGFEAQFRGIHRIALDETGHIYVAESGNHRIRKVTPAGAVTTLAGGAELKFGSLSGDFAEGPGPAARFLHPYGVAVDGRGTVYVADWGNLRIRKITPAGLVSTLAGAPPYGFADGPAASSRFSGPSDVAVDSKGNVYVADTFNHRIRKISPDGIVSTLAGSGQRWADVAARHNQILVSPLSPLYP